MALRDLLFHERGHALHMHQMLSSEAERRWSRQHGFHSDFFVAGFVDVKSEASRGGADASFAVFVTAVESRCANSLAIGIAGRQ